MKTRRTSIVSLLLAAFLTGPLVCCMLSPTQASTKTLPSSQSHDCCTANKPAPVQHDKSPKHDCSNCDTMRQTLQASQERSDAVFTHAAVFDLAAFIAPVTLSPAVQIASADRDTERVPILPDLFHQNCLLTV